MESATTSTCGRSKVISGTHVCLRLRYRDVMRSFISPVFLMNRPTISILAAANRLISTRSVRSFRRPKKPALSALSTPPHLASMASQTTHRPPKISLSGHSAGFPSTRRFARRFSIKNALPVLSPVSSGPLISADTRRFNASTSPSTPSPTRRSKRGASRSRAAPEFIPAFTSTTW